MLINRARSCWNMKKSPVIRWLHQRTHRMTDCMFPLPSGSALHTIHVQPVYWLMVSVGVSKLGCTGLIFVKTGVKVNGAYYRDVLLLQHAAGHRSYRRWVLHISAGQCSSALGSWDDPSSWMRDSCFHLAGFVAAEQPSPQYSWLQNLGPDAAIRLPDESAEHGRFEAAPNWCVEWNGTRRYWRRHWQVAQMSPCLCSGQRRTLRIFTLTC